jgi:acetyl-CoA carboxylase carboxyltransferase component
MMSWHKEIDELKQRHEMAKEMGGVENIARQHKKGRLTVRERFDVLLDHGSFREIQSLAGKADYDKEGNLKSFTHAPRITGYGMIEGRPVCIEGDDFTIRGGWADPTSFMSIGGFTPEKMALEWRIPFIQLLDSAGGSVLNVENLKRTVLLGNPERWGTRTKLMAYVPVVAAALGSLGGVPPVYAAASHWSIMTKKNSELFVAGPPLVKQALGIDITKEQLGNYKVHCYESGVIDNVAEDEEDAFRQIKRFLSYLPDNVWHQPPRMDTGDRPDRRAEELLSIIPRDRKKTYDMRTLIDHVVDRDSTFEISPFYGRSVITMLARMDGYPVALVANDCNWYGGAHTAAACEKMMRFVDFADTFHLPIIHLADSPGFMIGPESEKQGIERKSARLVAAMSQATVPGIPVLIRRSYGVAGALHASISRLNLRYAWPSGEWGSLPIEGGVMAAHRREIEAAPDPEAKRIELEEKVRKYASPFRTAEAFGVEEIIDPRDTRLLLCEFVRRAQDITATQLGPKARVGMRP